jgi:predicted phosphodiesterase
VGDLPPWTASGNPDLAPATNPPATGDQRPTRAFSALAHQAVRMRLGLLSDVHGDLVALEAVVADGRARGVDAWWVLGDLVAIGPDPVGTLELLIALPGVRFISGNTDRYVVTGDRPPPTAADVLGDPSLRPIFDEVEASFDWTRDVLDRSGWLAWLAALPGDVRQAMPDGGHLVGVHASPWSDDGAGITPSTGEDELRSMLDAAAADILVGGHTHRVTDRLVDGRRVLNLGSVGNPITDDPRPSWCTIDVGERAPVVSSHRVGHDPEAVLERIRRSGHPAAGYLSSFHRGGQVRQPSRPS